ncbi:hypothetical protein BDQ12DRAFT_672494 [Crucibulum laeve]|uniref:Uncharacterized protein n=1 Tax=Crucibulum laeve TaxID=68775 RepID=A0A5C3MFZ4_9AGAR|nr:hypothetical protein BDQ12DRAFT_672494 [Crucibulum laeve]
MAAPELPEDHLPIHLVGTPTFFPSLLSYIRNASANPASLPLDQVILQSLLLCIIAGEKNLILRTPEEDVGPVVKLTAWTLSSVFDFPTHKLKIRSRPSSRANYTAPNANPAIFLKSLFLPSASSSSNSNYTSQDEGASDANRYHKRSHSRSRSRGSKQRLKSKEYTRSHSFPTDLALAAQAHGTGSANPPRPPPHDYFGNVHHQHDAGGETFQETQSDYYPIRSNPFNASKSTKGKSGAAAARSGVREMQHAHTDPMLVRRHKKDHEESQGMIHELPRALVISGLEKASVSSQRALVRVLAEKKVVLEKRVNEESGTETRDKWGSKRRTKNHAQPFDDLSDILEEEGEWDLPEGFIMVYVCPWNATERPSIHKSLLDKFAMSSNIFIPQNIRLALRSLPFSPSLSNPQSYPFFSHSNPSTPSPAQHMSLPQSQTPPQFTKPLPPPSPHHRHSRHSSSHHPLLPKRLIPPEFLDSLREIRARTYLSPVLQLYLSDLFSATRHHSQLEATLLSTRATNDAEDLARASRVIGNDPTGMELMRPTTKMDPDDLSDFDRESSELDAYHGFARDVTVDVRSAYESSQSSEGGAVLPVLDMSEVDIARIFPRVVSHRVRLRDGPRDEILASVLFGATFGKSPSGAEEDQDNEDERYQGDTKTSVKDILVSIMAEV